MDSYHYVIPNPLEEKKNQLLRDHAQVLQTFSSEADEKLSRQQHILTKLQHEMSDVDRESRMIIKQLEEEIEVLIAQTQDQIDVESKEQSDVSSQLLLENGILTRRLTSTQKTIEEAQGKVAMMLDQTAKTQSRVSLVSYVDVASLIITSKFTL